MIKIEFKTGNETYKNRIRIYTGILKNIVRE